MITLVVAWCLDIVEEEDDDSPFVLEDDEDEEEEEEEEEEAVLDLSLALSPVVILSAGSKGKGVVYSCALESDNTDITSPSTRARSRRYSSASDASYSPSPPPSSPPAAFPTSKASPPPPSRMPFLFFLCPICFPVFFFG